MRDPIIVTAAPRAGTTLTMRLLHACGLQIGPHAEVNELREGLIRDNLYKPVLSRGGFDPLGQTSLPKPGWQPEWLGPEGLRRDVMGLVQVNDFDAPWGFKAIKGLLFHRSFVAAFPHAKWVIVQRDREEHIDSLLRTPFMQVHDTRSGWNDYLKQIDKHIKALEQVAPCYYFRPASVREGFEHPLKELCQFLGLQYNRDAVSEFNPHLYRTHE